MQVSDNPINQLVQAATALAAAACSAPGGDADAVGRRLRDCVIRPLALVLDRSSVSPHGLELVGTGFEAHEDGQQEKEPAAALDDRLWDLALAATVLRMHRSDLPEAQEAAAALQDLAVSLADDVTGVARLDALARLQAGLDTCVDVAENGPYLVTNLERLSDWLGLPLPVRPQMALCRCGGSENKPYCDGTHAVNGFTDAKDPNRTADRLDTYEGVEVTIQDNRGVCAHSGFCTDRLASVFHVNEEPFITPSGGRVDDIVRAVRSCPSGALSYTSDGVSRVGQADTARPAAIEVSKDGPYRVTGAIELYDHVGLQVVRNEGASLEHFSLCRCGHSQNKPFCSGMHYYVGFHDPDADPNREPTLFEWAGGLPALTRMTRLFYQKYVPEDPLLGPLFANMSPDHPERVAAWLGETFQGPKAYTAKYGGYDRMVSQHIGKGLTEAQRARWVQLIVRAADETGLPADPEFRAAFTAYLEWGSRLAVENSTIGAHPPEHMPVPRWWWVCDATPSARVSALSSVAEETPVVVLPEVGAAVSFEQNIKPLFRASDRRSMRFAFDLWSYDDVNRHADAIVTRLRSGTMPCDGAWPEPNVDAFQQWIDTGKAP
ncbi:CDGSH-type Zn-finger protein/truncated hemoglobin YjbI [Catenulispora sp. GAS73]|uniref:CDGSH iron-sulfur domain-containing protein n=1 Tax=Catenulispora sp. GAS73 TaxID=3156269 RepID=UPI0035194BC0